MTLYLRRDVSAGNRCFTVSDALGAEKYFVSTPTSGLMTKFKLVITDTTGNEAARIRRIPLVGTMTYVLRFGRKHVTLVTVPTTKGISAYFELFCVAASVCSNLINTIDSPALQAV